MKKKKIQKTFYLGDESERKSTETVKTSYIRPVKQFLKMVYNLNRLQRSIKLTPVRKITLIMSPLRHRKRYVV